jgi:3-oxoacyl-[acyl-carrier protein] reductase
VAIVTGGSRETGREVARALAAAGLRVALAYLGDRERAEALVDEILARGGAAVTVCCDAGDELDAERLFREAAAALGAVEVVVHVARGTHPAMLDRVAGRELRRGGLLVNVADVAVLHSLVPALSAELGERGIVVAGISAGPPRAPARSVSATVTAIVADPAAAAGRVLVSPAGRAGAKPGSGRSARP